MQHKQYKQISNKYSILWIMTETSKTVQTDYTTALQTEQLIYLFNAYIAYIATHWSTRCEH